MPSRSNSKSEQRRRKARAIGRHVAGKQRATEIYEIRASTARAFGNPPPPPPQRINYGCKQQPRHARLVQASAGTLEGMDRLVAFGIDRKPFDTHPFHAPACHYESIANPGSCAPGIEQLPADYRPNVSTMPPHIAREHAWHGSHVGHATNGTQHQSAVIFPMPQQQQQQYTNNLYTTTLHVPYYLTAPNGEAQQFHRQ